MKLPKTNQGKLILAYSYCALHIASWAIFLNSNGNEAWHEAFKLISLVIFFPLWVLTMLMGRLIWGSLNIFEANYIFGMFLDVAILSVLWTQISIFAYILVDKKRREHVKGS